MVASVRARTTLIWLHQYEYASVRVRITLIWSHQCVYASHQYGRISTCTHHTNVAASIRAPITLSFGTAPFSSLTSSAGEVGSQQLSSTVQQSAHATQVRTGRLLTPCWKGMLENSISPNAVTHRAWCRMRSCRPWVRIAVSSRNAAAKVAIRWRRAVI